MNITVAGSPEHENKLEEFNFRVSFSDCGASLQLVKFRILEREGEFEQWIECGCYIFPDLLKRSSLPEPELPEWAKSEALTNLLQHIHFK